MMAIHGKVQREGDVVHLIARQLEDLFHDLAGLAGRDIDFGPARGREDELAHGLPGTPNVEDGAKPNHVRDSFPPDLHIDNIEGLRGTRPPPQALRPGIASVVRLAGTDYLPPKRTRGHRKTDSR